ncbi:MAG: peptidase D-alanyl-D-alanine carboxypeptidase 1 [Frankiales bacterium]|nr:peptidase D-alanyl-D-alanine carboxypeptidase 1 [Frankiales bacterium]
MRTVRGALLALPLAVALTAGPTLASTTNPVGGSLLARRGTVVGVGAPKLPPTVAASWLVADLDTGEVLGSHDPHGRFAPASTLKTLTAETLIPKLDQTTVVQPTFDDLNVDGSKVGLVQQVGYPIKQLFTAMLVVSGNDAANTLATANGGVAKTVAEMNAEAARLQAFDTHAVNANGLDDPLQLSSAYDLALIARAAMKLPDFRYYVKIKRSSISGPRGTRIQIASHDHLLWNYPGAIGIKNGYTDRARATFVGAATRGGHTLVVTLMKTAPRYWPEAAALLDWGFAAQRAGVQPIGRLVDPDPDEAALLSAPQDAIAVPAANRSSVARLDGKQEGALVALSLVLLAFVVVRRRRS